MTVYQASSRWEIMKKSAIEPAASRFAMPTRTIPNLAIIPGIESGATTKNAASMTANTTSSTTTGYRERSSTSRTTNETVSQIEAKAAMCTRLK